MKKSDIIDIASQINSLYLQKGFIEPADYTITLLFISIYREEVIKQNKSIEDAASITLTGDLTSEDLQEIRKHFSVLDFFTKEDVVRIYKDFSSLKKDDLKNDFSTTFERLFNYLTGLKAYKNGAFILHRKMLELILKVADVNNFKSVYNPFASNATLGTLLNESSQYYGQEYNDRIWRIGKLRLLAFDKSNDFNYSQESSIFNWPNSNEKFDLIFSRLPLLNKIQVPEYKDYDLENVMISKSIQSIKSGGKVVLLMSSSFLVSRKSSNQELFKNLIENNLLEKIMFFPAGSFRHISISTSVVVLNSAKADQNIEIIDFSSFLNEHKSRKGIIEWDSVDQTKYLFKPWDSVDVNTEKIIKNDYNLNFANYLFESIFTGKKLVEYVEIISGSSLNEKDLPNYMAYQKASDDFDSKQELKLETFDISKISNIKNYKTINQRGVLISSIGNKLKPTYFDGSTSILIPHSIYLLVIKNPKELTARFLVYLLNSEEVRKQVEAITASTSIIKKYEYPFSIIIL